MAGGFTFCDTDIGSLGLYYVPELADTFVYRPAETQSHIETFEGHNGGYFYGSWYSPKEFTLRCYFENYKIDKGIMAQIYALFRVGRSGKLIFDRRPWCYYYATVTDPTTEDFTNYENGVITVHMRAMYPYARSDIVKNNRAEKYHDQMMGNTAVFEKDDMLLPTTYTDITSPCQLIIANQGTERAALGVAVAGNVGDGIIIANNTTGQSCKLVAIKKKDTTNVNKEVIVDPINGKTMLVGAGEKKLAFLYHEYGFLELETSFPAIRNLYINCLGSTRINVANILNENMIGKYIFAAGSWRKITNQPDRHTLIVNSAVPAGKTERTMVIRMNEISITPITTMDLSSLRFIYKPTYA